MPRSASYDDLLRNMLKDEGAGARLSEVPRSTSKTRESS